MKFLIICIFTLSLFSQEALYQWDLNKASLKGNEFIPKKGTLKLAVEEVKFSETKPNAYINSPKAVSILNADNAFPKKAISVASWVKVDKAAKWGGIFSLLQDNGAYKRGLILGYRFNKFCFAVSAEKRQSFYYMTSDQFFAPGFWYYVVGTYDGNELKLYVDGVFQKAYKNRGGDISYPETQLPTIGAYKDDDDYTPLDGEINQVSIYDTALTAEFIKAEFNRKKSLYPNIEGSLQNKGQWPTYLGDNQRQGSSPSSLPFPLKAHWLYKSRHQPTPAWPLPAKKNYWHNKTPSARVIFDRAYHLVGQNNFLYFASSTDHKIYCLDNRTGAEVWSYYTEAPVRLAPSLYDNKVYTGSDDGMIYCNDAATGKLIWKKKTTPDDVRLPGNEKIISQWPIRTGVLIEDNIAHFCSGLFPSQGVYRGAIDLKTGKVLANQKLHYSAQGYLKATNEQIEFEQGRHPAKKLLISLKRNFKDISPEVLKVPEEYSFSFIKAGNIHIGGGDGKIIAIDGRANKVVWKTKVEGKVYSLAVINNQLYASTDKGFIYCFGKNTSKKTIVHTKKTAQPFKSKSSYTRAANIISRILNQQKQMPKGYLLAKNVGIKELYLICKLSSYHIILSESNEMNIEKLRRQLDSLGLYGTRVSIHHSTAKTLPYNDGIFNLILDPQNSLPKTELTRLLQPYFGLGLSGKALTKQSKGLPPEGAGSWKNMFADGANTNCSKESNVGTDLTIQWFGPPGPRKMVDRHHRSIAPLSHLGRLFIPGENVIICSDAWNGTILWELPVPNSMRIMAHKDSSYLSVDDHYLYVVSSDKFMVVDYRKGKVIHEKAIPSAKNEWGYLGESDKIIITSLTEKGAIRRSQSRKNTVELTHKDYVAVITSSELLGYSKSAGFKKKWSYKPKGGIIHTSICLYNKKIYFFESRNAQTLLKGQQSLKDLLFDGSDLVCLDAASGRLLWKQEHKTNGLQHSLSLSATQGILICSGSRNIKESKPNEYGGKGSEVRYDLMTINADSGKLIWNKEINPNLKSGGIHGEQDRRPVLVGDKIYFEPYCFDLKTGSDNKEFEYNIKKRKGCGQMTASNNALYFRQDTVGGFNFESNKINRITNATRPGCWLNMIPACGLLLIPESSSGCMCNYAVQTSLAFRPKSKTP